MAADSLPENFLDTFDVKLQEFYYKVTCKEISLQKMWNVHAVNRATTQITEAVNRGDSSICFDSASKRCAYIMRHSTCFTSAVASYFLKLVNHKKNILRESLERGFLDICCLGGGPASDAVAVMKAVQGLYHPIWFHTKKKLTIRVTVVDMNEGWGETVKNVLNCFINTPDFYGEKELKLFYRFITADLTEPMSEKVSEALNNADIITLVYFLSAIRGSNVQNKSLAIIQSIMHNMKKGATFFFLDSAADHHCKVLTKAAEKWRSMQEIYGPFVEEFHTISLQSVSKFLELYARHFNRFFCMTNMFICVSVWQKMKIIPPGIKITKELFGPPPFWRTQSQEKTDELTKKMNAYCSSVMKLVEAEYSMIRAHHNKLNGKE